MQRIELSDGGRPIEARRVARTIATNEFDPSFAVRVLSDLVPNPFVCRQIVADLITALSARGFTPEKIGSLAALIVDEARKALDAERNIRAEAYFKQAVDDGRIQFRPRIDGRNWIMPFEMDTSEPENADQVLGNNGGALEKSLFTPVYQAELNGDERDVAVYLDADDALVWWHRNVAKSQYGLQGWKRNRIFPDFIFAATKDDGKRRMTVLETKGDQLDNADTAYKRDLLSVLSESFVWDQTRPSGELELVTDTGETVECTLILMSEWSAKLPEYLSSTSWRLAPVMPCHQRQIRHLRHSRYPMIPVIARSEWASCSLQRRS
ncbi:MAG: hypothetical protein CR993_09850 [Rhodobacterales bacterium]|nr:MAG: hypothetical protein CR993_09850 [Rhodobacterales bacterium]